MNDHAPGPSKVPAPPVDQEVSIRGIAWFIFGLSVFCLFAFATTWGVAVLLKKGLIARDPEPPAMVDARLPRPRPQVALQADPTADMERYKVSEEDVVTGYGWVDKGAGVARIPISRAMEIVAERGLPVVTGPAPAAPVVPAAPVKEARGK